MKEQPKNKIKEDKHGDVICSECRKYLEAIWENQGYTAPEGPKYEEIVGYKKCNCLGSNENKNSN